MKKFIEIAKSILGMNYKIEFDTPQGRYMRCKNSSATEWYLNNQLHRDNDLPAVICGNGRKEWYINGKLHREVGAAFEDSEGNKFWYKNNELHRIDGPAVECANGDRLWYIRNKLHRLNAPAVERINGEREWHVNGLLHREDGPAFEDTEGNKYWWLYGRQHTKEEFNKYLEKKKFHDTLQSKLQEENIKPKIKVKV